MRKPCLIKKALRLGIPLNLFGSLTPLAWENLAWLRRHYDSLSQTWHNKSRHNLWENLAWLRRHYDLFFGFGHSYPLKWFLWENLAWLRRHYDSGSYFVNTASSPSVRKPCLIKTALRHWARDLYPSPRHLVRKPCLIKKALRQFRLSPLNCFDCLSVRKPCLIKKALRPAKGASVLLSAFHNVRKPCLIKKALRRVEVKRAFARVTFLKVWENLAWLRRHYDVSHSSWGISSLFISEKTLPD